MKFLRIEQHNKKPVVVVEERTLLFFKREVKYIADRKVTDNYYDWRRLPDFEIVYDGKSFQLDSLLRNHRG